MERIIVTVKRVGEARVRDIEIAANVPVEQLATELAQALGWERDTAGNAITYAVEAHPPGRILQTHETLAQVQAWDGAWLVFHPQILPSMSATQSATTPATAAPSPPISQSPPNATATNSPAAGPVSGWKPLNLPSPSPPPSNPPPSDGAGFVWKQVDDD